MRIRQAGLEHPFIAAAHGVCGGRQAIADAEEAGQQRAAGSEGEGILLGIGPVEGHVALVAAHHGAKHLGGQIQVGIGYVPLDQQGRLHQVGEFGEQLLGQIGPGPQGGGGTLHLLANQLGPLAAVHLHTCGGEAVGIGLGMGNLYALRLQPMAAAMAASPQRRIAALQFHGQQLRIQQGHQPAHRSGEAALPLPPAHEPAPLQCPNPAGNQLGQHAGGGAPRLLHRGEHEGPLGRLAHLKGRHANAATAGKALGSLGGQAILEGLAGGGALALLHQV